VNLTVGLDLGQSRDYSALVICERLDVFSGLTKYAMARDLEAERGHVEVADPDERLDVRHIERFTLGTPYPAIVDSVGQLLARPQMRAAVPVIDATGVGRAVVDLFKEAYRHGKLGTCRPVPITFTGGQEQHGANVPKRDLVARLQALLQTGRLKIADGLPLADVLTKELLAFRAKISQKGHDTYEALRESDHDDLVMALALACWYRHGRAIPRYVTAGGEVVERGDLY
jgi:Terminase RNaseH-like domain